MSQNSWRKVTSLMTFRTPPSWVEVEVVVDLVDGVVIVVCDGVLGVEVHHLVIVDNDEGDVSVGDEQRAGFSFLSVFSVFNGGSDSRRG